MSILSVRATEGSTYVVTCVCTTEAGDVVTPDTDITWTVRSADGTQISTGTAAKAASVDVIIKGTDLSAPATTGKTQTLTLILETTYTSALGIGLPLVKIVDFTLDNELA